MANIFMLPVDVFLYILRYLDIYNRLAFALTCRMFRQICVDERIFRKMDLSRNPVSTMLRREINTFFRDRQLTQFVTELSFSNLRVLNWQIDDHLAKEVIIPNCHHLEALHIIDCAMSFQRIYHILKQSPKLTALSWSLWDFTAEDVQFIVNSIESSEGICFRNIKHLRLEMNDSKSHFQIAKYLLPSCFRGLEELEIYVSWIGEAYCTGRSFPLGADQMITGFPEPPVENELQHLHSLKVVAERDHGFAYCKEELSDFVDSVLRRNSNSTKWEKFWISPSIRRPVWSYVLESVDRDDFESIEAIVAYPGWSFNKDDQLKAFFERIGDNTVRSLHLCLTDETNSIDEVCDTISRVGGHSLKFLRLSFVRLAGILPERNILSTLFSKCTNITELDLIDCCFEKDICEPLSELEHLTKVQLMECAISPKYSRGNEAETSTANLLTFINNCKNITHFDVRGLFYNHMDFQYLLTDDDLLAIANLRKLKSLTLYNMSDITEWTFLKNISEQCKFLTMLRISDVEFKFKDSHIPILMESAKCLKHLAISVYAPVLESEVFWNLLSDAKNLERLCIKTDSIIFGIYTEWLNVPLAVEALKSLPRLHVLHLHATYIKNVDDFYDQLIIMLEEKESDYTFSFEIIMGHRCNTWISYETGCSLISNRALPLNVAELCDMRPVLDIPRF